MSKKILLVLTTTGTEQEAIKIGEELVSSHVAQCVNILPVPRSIYFWKEKICHDSEHLLLIKTSEERFNDVKATIHKLHSYELPEIVGVDADVADEAFANWVLKGVASTRNR